MPLQRRPSVGSAAKVVFRAASSGDAAAKYLRLGLTLIRWGWGVTVVAGFCLVTAFGV
jgi:hypothetical protein